MLWKDNMLEELARNLRETAHTQMPRIEDSASAMVNKTLSKLITKVRFKEFSKNLLIFATSMAKNCLNSPA